MPFGLSLKKLIRRDPTASLRDRAADLRASLSRRTVVAGTVAAAVPLPALALAPAPAPQALPHPDQDLFDIEALCARADAADKAAGAAHGAAYAAFRAALGPFPPELLMTAWEAQTFSPFYGVRASHRLPIRLVHHDDRLNPDFGWTGEALQRAIGSGPPCRALPRASPPSPGMRPLRRNSPSAPTGEPRRSRSFSATSSWHRSLLSRPRQGTEGPDPSRLPVSVRTAPAGYRRAFPSHPET